MVITIVDIVQTIDFYENFLGVQVLEFAAADGSRRWSLKFGVQKINLHQADVLFVPHAAAPGPGSADLCFLSLAPRVGQHKNLAAQGVNIIDGPVARSGVQGPITSLFIHDPNGNLLEISNLI